jgi:hypothetical protein
MVTFFVGRLSHGDVLGDSAAYFKAHSVFHFFLHAAAIGNNQDNVYSNKDTDDHDQQLSTHCVRTLHSGFFIFNVLFFVKVNAYLGFDG